MMKKIRNPNSKFQIANRKPQTNNKGAMNKKTGNIVEFRRYLTVTKKNGTSQEFM